MPNQNPHHIDATLYQALLQVSEYLEDEKADYDATPESERPGHVYHAVEVINTRLNDLHHSGMAAEWMADQLKQLSSRD